MTARYKKKMRNLRNGHSVYIPIYVQFSSINTQGRMLYLPARVTVQKVINEISAEGVPQKVLDYKHGRTSNTQLAFTNDRGEMGEFTFPSQYTEGGRMYDFLTPDFKPFKNETHFYNYYTDHRMSQFNRTCAILSDILDILDPESYGDSIVYVNHTPHDPLLCLGELLGAALRGNEDCMIEVISTIFMKVLAPDFLNSLEIQPDQAFSTVAISIIGENAYFEAIEESGGLDEDSLSLIFRAIYNVVEGYVKDKYLPYSIRAVRV
jgi:hypothetical protein